LHGHDFWVLAQGTGTYDADTVTLTTTNIPRRDVAMLPASGYLVLAHYIDNPSVSSPIVSLTEDKNADISLTGMAYVLPHCIAHF
jgi:hypothetical protein